MTRKQARPPLGLACGPVVGACFSGVLLTTEATVI